MESGPNARKANEDGSVDYLRAGGALKIRFQARDVDRGWLDFSPANMHIWLNGMELNTVQELTLTIVDSMPKLHITFTLDEIDIDMDTLMALHAIIERKKEAEGV